MSPSHHEDPQDTRGEPRQGELQRAPLARVRALEAVRAPDSLHRAVEQMVSDAAPRRHRRFALPRTGSSRSTRATRPLCPQLAAAGALLAAAAAVLALVLGSGRQAAPTVAETARVALEPATLPSPAENPRNRAKLAVSVEGLAFPYWGGQRGWPVTGARHDRLGGRSVTTVFYAARSGARIGYAIVAGQPLGEPAAGTALVRGGVRFRVLLAGGATVVTLREDGHTCILAARGVAARTMVHLVLS